MNNRQIENLIADWVESIIAGSERELVDVEYVKEGRDWVLRVFVDKPDGVDIEDCREISLALSKRLDEEDPIPSAYTLEVSSPGLERPLTKDEDYQRFSGRLVNVKTYAPIEGTKEFEGKLMGLVEGNVEVTVNGELISIPQEQVAKARLAVEF